MGSCTFGTLAFGKDAKAAYSIAVKEAQHEHGHDPYNGTISTTVGFKKATPPSRYGTKLFWNWMDEQLNTERYSKHNGCGCVEITGKMAIDLKKENGLAGTHNKVFYFFGWAND